MVDVSILIINFNTFHYLVDCVASVREKVKGVSYEIIIIDNGSTTGKAYDYFQEGSDLKIVRCPTNQSFCTANNLGVKAATGRYLLFINNDMLMLEDTVTQIFHFCESREREALVGCKLLNGDRSLQISISQEPSIRTILFESLFLYLLFPKSGFFNLFYQNYLNLTEPTIVDFVKGCFVFLRRESFLRLNGYDEDFIFYNDETDLYKRFKITTGDVIFYPGSSIVHFGGGTTGDTQWFVFKHMARSRIIYYKKWFSGIEFLGIMSAQYLGYLLRFLGNTSIGLFTLNKMKIKKGFSFFRMLFVYPKGSFKPQL